MHELLKLCPGVCGEIARAINSSLEDSQPAMSLAAALSFCATLKCGRVESEGFEPNLYAMLVADSGTGKSQVQKALNKIIIATEQSNLLMGKPASDAGILRSLVSNPRRLLVWDEFGAALNELAVSRNGPKALILCLLTDLFSAAGNTYLGKEYASKDAVNIDSPYLNILGASTSGRFFSSLSDDFVEDGFLPRVLVFYGDNKPVEQEPKPLEVSQSMIDAISFLESWEPSKESGNLSGLKVDKKQATYEMPFPHKRHKADFKARVRDARTPIERAFWARGREIYIKICLAVCETAHISSKDVYFAVQLAEFCIANQIEQCQSRLGETKAQKEREKLKNIIEVGERLTRSEISRRAWRLNIPLFERNALIEEFEKNGTWLKISEKGTKKSFDVFAQNSPKVHNPNE